MECSTLLFQRICYGLVGGLLVFLGDFEEAGAWVCVCVVLLPMKR